MRNSETGWKESYKVGNYWIAFQPSEWNNCSKLRSCGRGSAMQMIHCPNCGKLTGFKRSLGFGTFFMVVLTGGLWLLAIPFYPTRCITCGLTRSSAVLQNFGAWYRSLSPHGKTFMNTAAGILLLLLGVMWFNGARNPAARHSQSLLSSANYGGDAPDAGNDRPGAVAPVVYSVAEITGAKNQIPTGTELTVRGTFYRPRWWPAAKYGGDPCSKLLTLGTVSVEHGEANPRAYCQFSAVLQDEDARQIRWLECDMSPEELRAAIQQYTYGSRVQAHGTYGSSLDFQAGAGLVGLPVLENCTLEPLPPRSAPTMEAPRQSSSLTAAPVDSPVPTEEPSENANSAASSNAAAPAPNQSGAMDSKQSVSSGVVTKGQTSAEVLAILGPPASVTTGLKHVYTYRHLMIVFVDGKVSEIHHF